MAGVGCTGGVVCTVHTDVGSLDCTVMGSVDCIVVGGM